MSEKEAICPQCAEPLTSEAPGGLCPRCVMAMNMAPETMEMAAGAVPTVSELALHFPQLEILECLGRGGMGIVYKARQPQLDRFVALKILAPERVDDVRFAERFRREGVSLARLDHPNIVTVFDTGESGGFYYLLMEFVDGLNLREAIAGERMSAEEALAIVPPICAGLQYAHEQGVVHRDIKPENILLDKKGRVKIADFGVAKLVCGSEDALEGKEREATDDPGLTLGGKLGTPQYMAPEQEEKSGEGDHRSDIYALGVVLYEMLTGERPAKDLIAPSRKVEVDVRIDEIVLRALEKEPEKRYQTAGEFRTMVETMAADTTKPDTRRQSAAGDENQFTSTAVGQTVSASTAPAREQAWTWNRRKAWVFGIVSLGFAAIALGEQAIVQQENHNAWRAVMSLVAAVGFCIASAKHARAGREGASIAAAGSVSKESKKSRAWQWLLRYGLGSCVVLAVMITALLFWVQRPRMIDERTISADSPDGMYSAMGQTWRAMRVFDGDCTFYRFIVQGRAGAVFEKWEVAVPDGQLASSYVALSVDEIVFGKHGRIVWSEDGKRASFRVNEREVSAFNTVDGSHSFQDGFLPQRVVELSPAEDTGCAFLDLDTGRVLKPSEDEIRGAGSDTGTKGGWPQLVGTGMLEWMRSTGADLVMRGAEKGVTQVDGAQIIAAETSGPRADSRAFDTIPPARVVEAVNAVEKALAEGPRHDPPIFSVEARRVQAVKTREGAVALVEIMEQSKGAPLRLRYKLVKPAITARAAYVGEWEWREGGNSDDFCVLTLKDDGTAVVMEDGEDGETGEWTHAERGITFTVGGNTVTGSLDPNGCLVLGTGRGAPSFTRKGSGANAGQANTSTVPGKIAVEETALHFLVAIREKDEAKMRELCVDRIKGWTDALVGHFSMELRERFRQSTGEEFSLYPGESLVDGDLAAVKCRAANEVQKKLNGNILVLYFCRTEAGWKNWTLRKAMDSQPMAEHLEQARKWAAEWEDAPTLPGTSGNSSDAPAFGPVMERTVASRSKGGQGSYLNLETGRQMTPPKMGREASLNTELGTWARKSGLDGTIWLHKVDDIVVDAAFTGIDVLKVSAPDRSWRTMNC